MDGMLDRQAPDPAPWEPAPAAVPEVEPATTETGPATPEVELAVAAGPAVAVEPAAADEPGHLASPSVGRRRRRRFLGGLGAALLAVVLFGAGVGFDRAVLLDRPLPAGAPTATSNPATTTDFALIQQAWDLLHRQYVGASSLDSKKLAYGAIEGMTEAVGDTGHTTFLTPDELAASQAALAGSYAGIGAEMDTTGSEPIVVGVFRDSPADRAGLRSGDVVTAVDGTPTAGLPLDAVVARVRGPAGTPVTLTIRRTAADPNAATTLTLRIVRAEVTIPVVEWATIPGTTFVDLRVEQFSSGTARSFTAALAAALATHPTGLVLDLRGNPGGYVNEAVAVASQFLRGGTVYLARDASGRETPTPVSPGGIATSIRLVVLVDRGTASAAEIVTGALQDAGRATVVGVRTFGTGTVLGRFDLADGSALRIGTVEWLTPNGRRIWHEGLAPDVIVALPEGVRPVTPDDLAGGAGGAVGGDGAGDDGAKVEPSADVQLRAAISILTGTPPIAGRSDRFE